MRIIQIKQNSCIVEMENEELKQISNKTLYYSDLEKCCKKDINIPLGKWIDEFRQSSHYKEKQQIEALKSLITFFENRIAITKELKEENK